MFFYRIGFSLTSKNAKLQTKRLGLKAEDVHLEIRSGIIIHISLQHTFTYFKFYTNEYRTSEHRLEEECINMYLCTRLGEWKTPIFRVRQFLDHVLDIFHVTNISELEITTDHFETTIYDSFDKLEIESFSMYHIDLNRLSLQYALKKFSRKANQLSILMSRNPFTAETSKQLQVVLTRNMDHIVLYHPIKYDLNDLFVTNTYSLMVDMKIEDVNMFLKHWIHGLDRKLELACFGYKELQLKNEAVVEILFKNVDYQVAPAERELTIHPTGSQQICVKGGYDVRRVDGTEENITVNSQRSLIDMVFWS